MQKFQNHILFKTIKHENFQNVLPQNLGNTHIGFNTSLLMRFVFEFRKNRFFFFFGKHIFIYRSRTYLLTGLANTL